MGKRSNLLSENSVFATPLITSFSSVIGPFLFSSYLGLMFIWGLFDDQAFVFIMLFLLSRVCRKPNCTHIRKKTNPWVMLLFTREAGTLHLELRSREASSHSERCQRNWPEAQASIENGHYSPPLIPKCFSLRGTQLSASGTLSDLILLKAQQRTCSLHQLYKVLLQVGSLEKSVKARAY